MDLILYRYLLRRLVFYPVTFSRNKNFNSYTSEEGKKAVKRAKVIRSIINELSKGENEAVVEKNENSYTVIIDNKTLHIKSKYVIDEFEKEVVREKLRYSDFDYFNG